MTATVSTTTTPCCPLVPVVPDRQHTHDAEVIPSPLSAVVTCYDDGPIGFAVGAVAALSERQSLLSFAVRKTSLSWPQIRRRGTFCINVFEERDQHLVVRFTRFGADRFEGVAWTEACWGSPVLDGVARWYECSVWAEYDGGDHRIVVAQVQSVGRGVTSLAPLHVEASYPAF